MATKGFTAEERAAMKARVQEEKALKTREDGEAAIREAIAAMPEPDRAIAAGIDAIVTREAPDLVPRTWYGMPAYAKDDKVVCFFQPASKFKARYGTLGFQDSASLDDGALWPVAYAVTELTPDVEARIAELVRRAVS
jgi:uncharacterized protein YdhG (YjbR/CyaY superfamily)